MEMNTTEHGSSVTYPIQFIEQERGIHLPVPLVRVTCCGMMMLEVLKEVVSSDPPRGQYEVVSTQDLRGRGAVPSMMLLKLLASQPHRFATKDWLATQMQQEMERGALVRLDTIASQLRKQFRGLQGDDASALGLLLVAYLRNGRGSGPGYQLASYPLIWLDTDALAWNATQAARMERFGEDALPWWERAYALASRGEYLPDDPYSEWAIDKRAEVAGALRQCVHSLHHLYLSHHGTAGAQEAMRLLRDYWLSHKTDEDALRPLMELLGKGERYQEAEAYYQQLLSTLQEEDCDQVADLRTRDLREYLRTKQIQRQRVESPTTNVIEKAKKGETGQPSPPDSLIPPVSLMDRQNNALSIEDIIESVGKLEGALPVHLSDPINRRTMFARLLGISPTLFALDWHSISHFADALSVLVEEPSAFINEKTLMTFENVTENSWLLLRYDGLLTVEQLLPIYLQRFALFAHKSSPYQERIASIVAQGYMLQGLVAVLNSDATGSEKFCEQAVFYARLAKDRNLEAAALKHLATKFLDNGHPLWTLQTFQEVLPFVKDISPLLQGRTYLGLALAYARMNQESDALYYLDLAHDSFPENPMSDSSFSYADCHTSSLHHYGGLIHMEFARYEQARDLFVQVEELPTKSTIPERTRIEIMNCQTEASLALRDLRSSRDLIEKSITGALKLKSDKRYHDAYALYKQAKLLWPQNHQVNELANLFIC